MEILIVLALVFVLIGLAGQFLESVASIGCLAVVIIFVLALLGA